MPHGVVGDISTRNPGIYWDLSERNNAKKLGTSVLVVENYIRVEKLHSLLQQIIIYFL